MSAITPSAIQGIGTSALNVYNQTASALAGHPDLVHFLDIRTRACIFQFDAVINEQHAGESTITNFPVEGGQVVTDHIIVSPPTLTVQGIITDSPIGNKKALITEAIATGLTILNPPLLIAAAGVGYAATSTYQADQGASSPTQLAFSKLMLLQAGDAGATPPVPPSLFHVHTKLRVYTNMAIKSISIPRDRTVSNAIVVQIALAKVNIVKPQTINVASFADPTLAAGMVSAGTKQPATPTAFQQGITTTNNVISSTTGVVVPGGA